MTSVGVPFVVTINLKDVIGGFEDCKFTMLIDCKRMTIVYEVTEWIRWMFSIKNCIFLMHDSGIIHELEDIMILEVLKTFTVKLCPGIGCIHKKTYKTLLESIDFYSTWNHVAVPKIFVEKLGLINEKLCLKTQSTPIGDYNKKLHNGNHSNCEETSNEGDLSSVKLRNTNGNKPHGKLDTEISEVVGMKSSPAKVDLWFNTDKKKHGSRGDINTNTVCSSQDLGGHLENNMSKVVSSDHMKNAESDSDVIKNSSNNDQELSNPCEPPTPNKRWKKSLKPFSLAEMLASLREENQKQLIDNSLAAGAEQNVSTTPNQCEDGTELECVKRKRKRVRKKKNKNKNLLQVDDLVEVEHGPPYGKGATQDHEKTANHIRFNSFSEDEEEKDESLQGSNANQAKVNGEVNSSTPVITPGAKHADGCKESWQQSNMMETNFYENSVGENGVLTYNCTKNSQPQTDNFDFCHNNLEYNMLNGRFPFPKVYQRYN